MSGDEERPALTFAWLDAQIEALPEGPAAALDMPGWLRHLAVLGVVGVVLGLLPSLLVQWWPPAMWMLACARVGLALVVVGFVPVIVRSLWVLTQQFRHHRRELVVQFDFDMATLCALARRLSVYPRETLERQRRCAAIGQERLASRLVMLLGGIERLGLLPLLLSLFVLLRNWRDLLALPGWLALLGILAAILWLIGWAAAEFRRRLHLYEFLLQEALLHRSDTGAGAAGSARE